MALRSGHRSEPPPAPQRAPPPPPNHGLSLGHSSGRTQALRESRRLKPRAQVQQLQQSRDERQRLEELRHRSAQHYTAVGEDMTGWSADDTELRNRQFELLEAFTEDPTRTFESKDIEAMPWWLRVIHDREFRQSLCTSITGEIRKFEEKGDMYPQTFVTAPGTWAPKSALNRIPGDGLTYRWLTSFPPTGWVHLPFASARQLGRTGAVGVNVFSVQDPNNYGQGVDDKPFMHVELPEAVKKEEDKASLENLLTFGSPTDDAVSSGFASPASAASPAMPSLNPSSPGGSAATISIGGTAATRRRKHQAEDHHHQHRPAKRITEVFAAGRGNTFPKRRWNFAVESEESPTVTATASAGGKLTASGKLDGSATRRAVSSLFDGSRPSSARGLLDQPLPVDEDLTTGGGLSQQRQTHRSGPRQLRSGIAGSDAAAAQQVPQLDYVGTLRASHRLLRFQFLARSLRSICQGSKRAPYPKQLGACMPEVDSVTDFSTYDRTDLTDSRIEFLFSSDECRDALRLIFGELPKDINGRATKVGFIQLVLDLVNLFMPSFYNQSNIDLAEDEWVCRGTRERPDVYQFVWFFFDFPIMVMRAEYLSEDLYAAFWRMVHHEIFVKKSHRNSDDYDDHLLRRQLLEAEEVQLLSPSRRVLHVQRLVNLRHASERRVAHRRAIQQQYYAEGSEAVVANADPAATTTTTVAAASHAGTTTSSSSPRPPTASSPTDGAPADESGAAPPSTGNVFLDRRREDIDVMGEWSTYMKNRRRAERQLKRRQQREQRGGSDPQAAAADDDADDSDEDAARRAVAVEDAFADYLSNLTPALILYDVHAPMPRTVDDVNAEIHRIAALINEHDELHSTHLKDGSMQVDPLIAETVGHDRDDVDSLLSYCSDMSDHEFESPLRHVRSEYHKIKNQEHDSERAAMRRRIKLLNSQRASLIEAERAARAKQEEQEREEEEERLRQLAFAAGGGRNDSSFFQGGGGSKAGRRMMKAASSFLGVAANNRRRQQQQQNARRQTTFDGVGGNNSSSSAIRGRAASVAFGAMPLDRSIPPEELAAAMAQSVRDMRRDFADSQQQQQQMPVTDSGVSPTKKPPVDVPEHVVARAREVRRERMRKLDSECATATKGRGGKYSMFAKSQTELPPPPAPMPPNSASAGASARRQTNPALVEGMSPWGLRAVHSKRGDAAARRPPTESPSWSAEVGDATSASSREAHTASVPIAHTGSDERDEPHVVESSPPATAATGKSDDAVATALFSGDEGMPSYRAPPPRGDLLSGDPPMEQHHQASDDEEEAGPEGADSEQQPTVPPISRLADIMEPPKLPERRVGAHINPKANGLVVHPPATTAAAASSNHHHRHGHQHHVQKRDTDPSSHQGQATRSPPRPAFGSSTPRAVTAPDGAERRNLRQHEQAIAGDSRVQLVGGANNAQHVAVDELKFSRSLLQPSRAVQTLFPLHPRTVLVGKTAGSQRDSHQHAAQPPATARPRTQPGAPRSTAAGSGGTSR